jgi:putative transposase
MAVTAEPLDTIWEVPDELWQRIEPILLEDAPPKATGRPRAPWRRILNAIIFRLRTGCQWNKLPKEFGSDRTAHRWFQRRCANGVFAKVWAAIARECEELGGVDWLWQAADGQMGKARFGGAPSAPTPPTGASRARRRASSSRRPAGRWGR